MALTLYERETILLFNEEEKTASVETFNSAMLRKLQQLAKDRPADCRMDRDYKNGCKRYIIPKRWIKVNAGPVLSAEQRAKKSNTAKALFSSQTPTANGSQETKIKS